MQVDLETYTETLVTITRGTLAFFLNPNAALHKGISVFLIRYYPMLSEFTFSASIAQQIIGLYLETLQFKYQHAWTYILPSISGMVRLLGPQFPYMFNDLLQQLLAIYDSSVKGDAAYVAAKPSLHDYSFIVSPSYYIILLFYLSFHS